MHLWLNRRVAAFAIALCFLIGASAHAGLLPERVAKAAQARIADNQTLVFGVVDGKETEVVAFGNFDNGERADGDTVYEIGSIMKTFTATLLTRAVLAGDLTLKTPVAQLLPDFKIPARHGKAITLGMLATQHSGLPRLPSNMLPRDPANPFADYDAAKLKTFLAEYQLPRDPGASYEYSNLGVGLLGYALAQREHTIYGPLVQEQILKPLGMTMSGTVLTDAMRAHLAPGHDSTGKVAKNFDFDVLAGAGAIRSSANDMLRYLKANMGVDPSFLFPAMIFAHQPRTTMLQTLRIGLAWMITGKGVVWHSGMTYGYAGFLGFTSDGRRGVVVLANTAADADDLGFATLDDSAPLAPAYKTVGLPSASLDDYVGTYRLKGSFLITIFRMNDALFAQATGQPAFPIFPSAPNEFFARLAGISISFTRDFQSAVSGLVLHQEGDHAAPKLAASELPRQPVEVSVDAAALGDYPGKYAFDFGAVLDVTLTSGHLEAQLTGQRAFPIFPSGKDKFFYKVVDAQLDFERDAGGNVLAVVLHQNGRDVRATRIDGKP